MEGCKNNRKSLRLTNKVCRIVEGYRGNNFNEKLENLILDFDERRDSLIQDWSMLQASIGEKRVELRKISKHIDSVREIDKRLNPLVDAIQVLIRE